MIPTDAVFSSENMANETSLQCENGSLDIKLQWKIVLVLAYSTVGVASLVGNMSVLLIVVCRKEMRTVTNIFISSVSAADLLITGVSLWATPLAYYQIVWRFGNAMCYIVYVVQGASLMWVPMTLAAIAIDRYLLVASPFRKQMSLKMCLLVIVGIWLGAFAVLTPMLTHVHFFEVSKCNKYCIEYWPADEHNRMFYGLSVLLIRSALPLIIISWCHWRIASILNAQTNRFKSIRSGSLSQSNDIRRKQRLQTLLLAMVIIFAVSSLPIDLFNVLQDMEIVYKIESVSKSVRQFIFFFSHWIAMTGTLLNPLVYAWWNENFRRQIQGCVSELRGSDSFKRGLYTVIVSGKATRRFDHDAPLTAVTAESKMHIAEEIKIIQMEEAEDDVQV